MAFETRKLLTKHNLIDEHLDRTRKEVEDAVEDGTMERVYDTDQDENFLTHKPKAKNKPKSQIQTQPRTQIETTPKVEVLCLVCGEKLLK